MASSAVHPVRQLVGRRTQLAVADAHLDALERGRGGLLLLTGEPGIGKTRLAEEIAERGARQGARTVWATAWQGDGAPPLWAWVQVLRQLTGSTVALDQPPPESPAASPAARFAQLEQQATAGLITLDADSEDPEGRTYSLSPAAQECLLDPDSLASMGPLFDFLPSVSRVLPARAGASRSAGGRRPRRGPARSR